MSKSSNEILHAVALGVLATVAMFWLTNVTNASSKAGTTTTVFDVLTANSLIASQWYPPVSTRNTNISMTDGNIFLNGSNPSVATQSTSGWSPEVSIQSPQGTAIWGHLAILNHGNSPGIDWQSYCTGTNNLNGFQNGCDIGNNSSDSDGEIWLTGGASGTSSTGIVQMVFGGEPWTANIQTSGPYCQLTLRDEGAQWVPGATVKEIAPLGGRTRLTALTVAWDNNGVPMPFGAGGPGVGIAYFCVTAP